MMLIGLVGQKQVGKDTIANHLIKNYNYNKYSFADPLKEACKHIFRLTDEQLYKDKEIPDPRWNNVTPRKLLQVVGTQLFREELINQIPELAELKNTTWIHNFELWYKDNKDINIVIPDVRFGDEADIIKKNGGILIRVNRGEFNTKDLHKSEQELNDIKTDIIINNDSSLDDLHKKIDTLF